MSFARRQTKTSTSRHTTWQQKQALKLAIAFSWLTRETFDLLSTQPQTGLASSSTEPEGGVPAGVSDFWF